MIIGLRRHLPIIIILLLVPRRTADTLMIKITHSDNSCHEIRGVQLLLFVVWCWCCNIGQFHSEYMHISGKRRRRWRRKRWSRRRRRSAILPQGGFLRDMDVDNGSVDNPSMDSCMIAFCADVTVDWTYLQLFPAWPAYQLVVVSHIDARPERETHKISFLLQTALCTAWITWLLE